ncbi:hypothetical protein BDV98DRAFT_506405, partial [Pterulicium gracile]
YPWPVNLLHYYVLLPNPSYLRHLPISKENLPYDFPPQNLRTITSPVRLFAQTACVLGRWRTVLWIDSHTEDYYGPSGSGQRLAGCVERLRGDGDEGGAGPAEEGEESGDTSSVFAKREVDAWVSLGVCEEHGQVAVGMKDGGVEVFGYVDLDPS